MKKLVSIFLLFFLCSLSACSTSYKSTWNCPKVKGIGCSSVEFADLVAREKIVLNKKTKQKSNPCPRCHGCNKEK